MKYSNENPFIFRLFSGYFYFFDFVRLKEYRLKLYDPPECCPAYADPEK